MDTAPQPLVLIHGLGSERAVWEPVLEPLTAAGFDVIAVDLPGFGDADPLPDGVTPDPPALARHVAAELDQRGIDKAHIAGNSLGGWVALELALLGRARSVTALCPAGFWREPLGPDPNGARAHKLVRQLRPLIPAAMRVPAFRHAALSSVVAHPQRVPTAAASRMVVAYGSGIGYPETSAAMRAGRFENIDRVQVPATLVFGDRDRLIRPKHIETEYVRTVLFEDCGHVPMWDKPDKTVAVICDTARR